ncbi:hypothetical protein KC660_03330 [Candidatus Dojkabacteria bacterium]|uniref:DUF4406 domain-containing protein n=1 Tax=Candidatus Dojkabacteria bacterium TaxID=2099670 RepID=A0A955L4A2_9BACT|nr:hypothetical protein [Candidatus Dojkabacteria bacterium]
MSEKITICGSMQFAKEMIHLKHQLEDLGWIVLTPDFSEKSSTYESLPFDEKIEVKKEMISNHFGRIKQSTAILVANHDKKGTKGYIGSNTLMEVAVAHVLHKAIYILNDLGPQDCEEEITALSTSFLDGDLKNI